MKNVIIVDPFSTGSLLAPKISSLGHQVYGVISNKNISNHLLSSYSGEGFINNELMSVSELKRTLLNADVVITGSESGVYCSDELSSYFRVSGNCSDTSDLRRNKYLMHKKLSDNGMNYIKSYEIDCLSYKDIILNLDENKEYVLKPISSAGSDNVKYFENKIELLEYISDDIWHKVDLFGKENSKYLVQEYINSDEYVVDMVAKEGRYFISSLCAYKKFALNKSKFVYKELDILDPNDSKYSDLINYAISCANCLDISYGPIHMELFYDNNTPVMIEVGARLHGGIAPILFNDCYSPNLLDTVIDLYINDTLPSIDRAKMIKNGKIHFLANSHKDSFIKDSSVFHRELEKLSSFSGCKLFYSEREKLPLTTDLTNIPGIVWLSSDNKEQLNFESVKINEIFYRACYQENSLIFDRDNVIESFSEDWGKNCIF